MDDPKAPLARPIIDLAEDRHQTLSYSSQSLSHANQWSIVDIRGLEGEPTTQEIICAVHPTIASEEMRGDVINYLQRIIRGCAGIEVFPVGSVPGKTYLPYADIDLSVFCSQDVEEEVPNYVYHLLEKEMQNDSAEFDVEDVRYIDAKIKLVKCMVEDLCVDISFNQLGGLSKLCFLEQVDRFIGQDHLLKRSIILIKSWCYYESRILGAHHNLISSYALETLVLYIFQLFNKSLNCPLPVLYRFLDYYSKFDWEKYCISLIGPICISHLPQIVVKKPENNGSRLLLSEQYLKNCVDLFCAPQKVPETKGFLLKHLNIFDPLNENNNLGASISKANFYRICNAFSFGAQELSHILSRSGDIRVEINKFFSTLLREHGNGQRLNVHKQVLSGSVLKSRLIRYTSQEGSSLGCHETQTSLDLSGDYAFLFSSLISGQSFHNGSFTGSHVHGHLPSHAELLYDKSHLTTDHSLWVEQRLIPHANGSHDVLGSFLHPVISLFRTGAAFGGKEMQGQRGLGTFFPRMDMHLHRDRLSLRLEKKSTPRNYGVLQKPNAGGSMALSQSRNPDKGGQVDATSSSLHGKHGHVEFFQEGQSHVSSFPNSSYYIRSENPKCVSFGHLPWDAPFQEVSRCLDDTSLGSPTMLKPPSECILHPDSDLPPENHGCGSSGHLLVAGSSLEAGKLLDDISVGSPLSLSPRIQEPILESLECRKAPKV